MATTKPRSTKSKDTAATPAPAAAAPVVAAAPATPVVEKKKPAAAKKAVAAAAPVAAAPAAAAPEAAAPEASPVTVSGDAAPTTNVSDDIRTAIEALTRVRDETQKMISNFRKLDKRVAKEIKEARKRRRVKREVDPSKPERPNPFKEPQRVSDALCKFFSKPTGTLMNRAEVTSGVSAYVKKHGLQDKHSIKPDAALKALLEVSDADAATLTYFNIQKYLNKHYLKNAAA